MVWISIVSVGCYQLRLCGHVWWMSSSALRCRCRAVYRRKAVFPRMSRASVVGFGCTGSELLLLRLPTCLFESKCQAFALNSTYTNVDSSWRCVLLRRDLWAKGWQHAHSSPDFSLYCTSEYESFAFFQHSSDQYLERNKFHKNEKGFKCSEFEGLPSLRTFPALRTLHLTGSCGIL